MRLEPAPKRHRTGWRGTGLILDMGFGTSDRRHGARARLVKSAGVASVAIGEVSHRRRRCGCFTFRGAFAYVDGQHPNGDTLPLMRLRYGGSAARWGFAMYLASKDGYDAVLPTGAFAGLAEDASTAPPASTSATPRADQPPTDSRT